MILLGKRVGVLVADLYEDPEFWYPYLRLQEEGARVVAVGPEAKEYKSKHGYPAKADLGAKEAGADDLENAGATWVDAEVVRDGNLITSRHPGDLPAFMREVISALQGPPLR